MRKACRFNVGRTGGRELRRPRPRVGALPLLRVLRSRRAARSTLAVHRRRERSADCQCARTAAGGGGWVRDQSPARGRHGERPGAAHPRLARRSARSRRARSPAEEIDRQRNADCQIPRWNPCRCRCGRRTCRTDDGSDSREPGAQCAPDGLTDTLVDRRNHMNRVVHFEIPADDLERAKNFYKENFGWKLNQFGPEMGNYVLVHTGPTDDQGMPQDKAFINGGIMPRDPSARSPVIVISVDEADQTVEKVKNSGGKLVGEILDIPGVGRYARVQDPEGNVIGVIKPLMRG